MSEYDIVAKHKYEKILYIMMYFLDKTNLWESKLGITVPEDRIVVEHKYKVLILLFSLWIAQIQDYRV